MDEHHRFNGHVDFLLVMRAGKIDEKRAREHPASQAMLVAGSATQSTPGRQLICHYARAPRRAWPWPADGLFEGPPMRVAAESSSARALWPGSRRGDAPHDATHVVGHQQCAPGVHRDADRPALDLVVGVEEAGEERLGRHL